MPLTPEDVQKKQFSTVRFKEGYDEEEVDAFLDEVEAELRRLLAEHQSLSRVAQSSPAAAPVAAPAPAPAAPPAEDPSETALRTLLLAQRTADEAIAQARAEAEQVVAQARTRAGSIESEAQQHHATAMAELNRQRETFERQIDNLRAFEREYRTRLKAYLESQLRDLDGRGQGLEAEMTRSEASRVAGGNGLAAAGLAGSYGGGGRSGALEAGR
jgi:DivIVA domain-containing protein